LCYTDDRTCAGKDTRRAGGPGRGAPADDLAGQVDDQTVPEAPKMVVFGTIRHPQAARMSSYSEAADRSECLRRYNLNDTLATSMLLTAIRDIDLEPLLKVDEGPQWKLIRPKKPRVLPHAEPVGKHQQCPNRTAIGTFAVGSF
jgi:hypothetical protein